MRNDCHETPIFIGFSACSCYDTPLKWGFHRSVACGSRKDLQHHHLVTRKEGGSDDPANLITLCCGCYIRGR